MILSFIRKRFEFLRPKFGFLYSYFQSIESWPVFPKQAFCFKMVWGHQTEKVYFMEIAISALLTEKGQRITAPS